MNVQMIVKICPVCGMDVDQDGWSEMHTGIKYVFCSSQCRDNFVERPLLYMGKHAKHENQRLMQRKFHLERFFDDPSQSDIVCEELSQMMGVKQVEIEGREIRLTYDLFQCTAKQIEERLRQAGVRLGKGWADKLKRGWMKYTEENELDNLLEQPKACCNRPPRKG